MEQIKQPYSNSAKSWAKLISCIEEQQCSQIIFIINDEEQEFILDVELKKYKNLDVRVVKDDIIEKGNIKILLEE